jgi:hypothetical protein
MNRAPSLAILYRLQVFGSRNGPWDDLSDSRSRQIWGRIICQDRNMWISPRSRLLRSLSSLVGRYPYLSTASLLVAWDAKRFCQATTPQVFLGLVGSVLPCASSTSLGSPHKAKSRMIPSMKYSIRKIQCTCLTLTFSIYIFP